MVPSRFNAEGIRQGLKGEGMTKEKDDDIKVNDRRLFSSDGSLRGELPEEEPAPEVEVKEEKVIEQQGEAGGFERKPLEEPEGVDFTMLLNAMAQPALIFLGEVAHPGTGQAEVNLEQARMQIDLLDMLRIKCRGNLTAEEEGLLDRILYQLRMLFVSRSNQPEQ
jgi:hypothetical protein